MFHKVAVAIVILSVCNDVLSYKLRTTTLQDVSDAESAKVLVMGDWGGIPLFPYYSPFEYVTAKRIMKVAAEERSDFLLALGDNFYENGVTNEFDPRFKTTFEDVFNDPSFLHIPWYVVGGNHDHYGNITGQLEYSKHSSRWMFPNLWYTVEVRRAKFNMTIIMIDTVTLCGNTLPDSMGGQPDGKVHEPHAVDQLSFIEDKLKNNPNQYILVAGHFPVWSVAEHGPSQCLLDKLKPLLEKYKATAYLCGHDHNLQHIREANSTVEYILSGAVDVVDPSTKHKGSIPADSLRFYWGNLLGMGGFATLNVTSQSMVLNFHSATGGHLYKYAIPPRK